MCAYPTGGLVVAVRSHEPATFQGGGGHFCGEGAPIVYEATPFDFFGIA